VKLMFDWLSHDDDAIGLLKQDHDRVKELFDAFEKAESQPAKAKIAEQAITELKAHAALEEELFYPAVRKKVGKDLMNEADEEHHVAKVLIAELEVIPSRDDHYNAKFTVLAENVRHHIKEEENEVLPKAKEANIDFKALGELMLRRKQELLAEGFPPTDEERMVAPTRGRADSPAKAARKTTTKAKVKAAVKPRARKKRAA